MCRNLSSVSTSVSRWSSSALLLGRHRLAVGAALDLLPQPDALLVRRDVLDLVRHRAAVGRLEVGQRLGEGPAGHRDAEHLGGDGRHHLGREAERAGVERRVADRRRAERIQLRGQVAVHAERLHQRHRGGHVVQHLRRDRPGGLLARLRGGRRPRELVAGLAEAEALGDELVEALVALEQLVDRRQERPRLRALDDAVIVGAGDGHDLAHAELAEPLLGHGRRTRPGSRWRRPR